jgi:hypothetical protein
MFLTRFFAFTSPNGTERIQFLTEGPNIARKMPLLFTKYETNNDRLLTIGFSSDKGRKAGRKARPTGFEARLGGGKMSPVSQEPTPPVGSLL